MNKRWKFVYSAPDQRELLFDRVMDPGETKDLAQVKGAMARERRTELQQWLRACGQEDAFTGDGWRPYPKLALPPNPDAGLIYQDHPWAKQHISGYSD